MRTPGLFHIDRRPAVSAGDARFTRLNIYSGLYVEWARTAVLIDPAKVPAPAAARLDPGLILVSHESMDHFDAPLCAALLRDSRRRLVGSWGVVLAFADYLAPADPRWWQIVPGVPGCRYEFGDLVVDVHASIHCEYAVPLFFDVRDRVSGFRFIDAIDTAITPEMQDGSVPAEPDVLIAPAGIALGITPRTAWQMAGLLRPAAVMAGHLTRERGEFLAQSSGTHWQPHQVHAPDWHEALVFPGGDPRYEPGDTVQALTSSGLSLFTEWLSGDRAMPPLLERVRSTLGHASQAHALYALACELARGRSGDDVKPTLSAVGERVLTTGDEPLMAAWLLAWGVCLGAERRVTAADLDRVSHLLSPDRPYLGYWVLECWGRSAANPRLTVHARERLDEVAADPVLWDTVGVRRKLMWELERLVRAGVDWPGIPALLARALTDANPDVRLLAFRILPLVDLASADRRALLRAGLSDAHEDVLEEAVAAHITTFDQLTDDERQTARERLASVQQGPTYHVRERANVLAELLETGAGCAGAALEAPRPLHAEVEA